MAPVADDSKLETLRVADLNWLANQRLSRVSTPWAQLPPEISGRVAEVYWHLLNFTEKAVRHEGHENPRALRDQIVADFAERVGQVAQRSLPTRKLVRVLWRLHTPRSWLIRQLKATLASKSRPLPVPNGACSLEQARGQETLRQLPFCVIACDLRFLRDGLELSFAEIGFVFGIPKSTAASFSGSCRAPENRSGKSRGLLHALPDVTPEQVASYWELLGGVGLRSGIRRPLSLWKELQDAARSLWLLLR